jgi:dTDP-4-amino-4,6-dideoxygalactose transaminase
MLSKRVLKVFEHKQWILGPEVGELEKRVEIMTGRHAVACGSGADALYLAHLALGVGEFELIATTPFTFGATAAAIARAGARPIFVDVDEDLQISADGIERAHDKNNLSAVVTVDLFGGFPHYIQIAEFCQANDIKLIEDAAQAFGAEYDGRPAGSLGDAGCFSFHPSKPLGAMGDAGMVVFFDGQAAEFARRIRNHGIEGGGATKYLYTDPGLNSRMDSIQAAALLDKLDRFPAELARRRTIAAVYRRAMPFLKHPVQPGGVHNPSFAIYPVIFESNKQRQWAMMALTAAGLWNRVYYPIPLHLQPAYSWLGHKLGDFPVAEKACERILALPLEVGPDEASRVVEILKKGVG